MKNLSYQQVIHIKLWITFLNFFKKSLAFYIFMCYNIEKVKDNTYIKGGYILWQTQLLY